MGVTPPLLLCSHTQQLLTGRCLPQDIVSGNNMMPLSLLLSLSVRGGPMSSLRRQQDAPYAQLAGSGDCGPLRLPVSPAITRAHGATVWRLPSLPFARQDRCGRTLRTAFRAKTIFLSELVLFRLTPPRTYCRCWLTRRISRRRHCRHTYIKYNRNLSVTGSPAHRCLFTPSADESVDSSLPLCQGL